MPRLPRCRPPAVMKWTGAAACVLLLTAWVLSGWLILVGIDYSSNGHTRVCKAQFGRLKVRDEFDPAFAGVEWKAPFVVRMDDVTGGPIWRWGFAFDAEGSPGGRRRREVTVPLWAPFGALLIPTGFLFYLDRRAVRWSREGRCVACGYDVSGVSGTCPECGREGTHD